MYVKSEGQILVIDFSDNTGISTDIREIFETAVAPLVPLSVLMHVHTVTAAEAKMAQC